MATKWPSLNGGKLIALRTNQRQCFPRSEENDCWLLIDLFFMSSYSCMQAGIEEKILSELKGQSGESVSIHQGWQKRCGDEFYERTFIDDQRIIKKSHELRCAY